MATRYTQSNVGRNVGMSLLKKFLKWGVAIGFIAVLAGTRLWPLAVLMVASAIIVEGTPIATGLQSLTGWLWS